MADVERNTPAGTHLAVGWLDAEHDITHAAYCAWAQDLIDDLEEGVDIGTFQTFDEWKQMKRDEDANRDELGFSHEGCDLCGGLAGDRHAVTAMPDSSESDDYYALRVCGNCLQYIANGEVPDDSDL